MDLGPLSPIEPGSPDREEGASAIAALNSPIKMTKDVPPYNQGVIRNHHRFYIDQGDLVLQVEKAIFKIHRHFLIKYSPVMASMFEIGQNKQSRGGTEEEPLKLDDSVKAWELLLEVIYPDNPFGDISYSGDQYILVLRLAHKYSMQVLENSLVKRLQRDTTDTKYINLLQAAWILGSAELQKEAFNGLVSRKQELTRSEAHTMGVDILYDVMISRQPGRKMYLR